MECLTTGASQYPRLDCSPARRPSGARDPLYAPAREAPRHPDLRRPAPLQLRAHPPLPAVAANCPPPGELLLLCQLPFVRGFRLSWNEMRRPGIGWRGLDKQAQMGIRGVGYAPRVDVTLDLQAGQLLTPLYDSTTASPLLSAKFTEDADFTHCFFATKGTDNYLALLRLWTAIFVSHNVVVQNMVVMSDGRRYMVEVDQICSFHYFQSRRFTLKMQVFLTLEEYTPRNRMGQIQYMDVHVLRPQTWLVANNFWCFRWLYECFRTCVGNLLAFLGRALFKILTWLNLFEV